MRSVVARSYVRGFQIVGLAACALLPAVACSADGGSTPRSSGGTSGVGQGGSATGGAGASGASAGGTSGGTAGAVSGGSGGASAGNGGSSGGAGGSDASGGSGGSGAEGGSGGSGGASAWSCPAGPFEAPVLGGTAERVAGVPPPDSFNMNNGNFGNVEGPVWLGDALYVSEMSYMSYDQQNPNVNRARVLKVTSAGVEIAIADSGSNGLAIDTQGNLIGGIHKDGSVSILSLSGGAAVPIVSMYMGSRFSSPNDLTVRSDGNIYFTDPSFQAPNPNPQSAQRLYRIAPGATTATAVENLQQPNGVTLSPDENTLYVAGGQLRKYPVAPDGSLGTGSDFLPGGGGGGDGMVVDCAGNLYVAGVNSQASVTVYNPAGSQLGTISAPGLQQATNVAFGGPDHKTLYITGLGNAKGLFRIEMNVPGMPY